MVVCAHFTEQQHCAKREPIFSHQRQRSLVLMKRNRLQVSPKAKFLSFIESTGIKVKIGVGRTETPSSLARPRSFFQTLFPILKGQDVFCLRHVYIASLIVTQISTTFFPATDHGQSGVN